MSSAPNQGLPLEFMYDGMIFSKQIDGYYHWFKATTPRIKENSIGRITISEAKDMFNNCKFIGSIIVLSDDINIKV